MTESKTTSERLTGIFGSPCNDCDNIRWCISDCYNKKLYDKLRYYEDLEDQGKMMILPCAVGEPVYFIGEDNSVIEVKTQTIEEVLSYKPLVGKGCYVTPEAVEAALKRRTRK